MVSVVLDGCLSAFFVSCLVLAAGFLAGRPASLHLVVQVPQGSQLAVDMLGPIQPGYILSTLFRSHVFSGVLVSVQATIPR